MLKQHPSKKFYTVSAGYIGGHASRRSVVLTADGKLQQIYRICWTGKTSGRCSHWVANEGDIVLTKDAQGHLWYGVISNGKMESSPVWDGKLSASTHPLLSNQPQAKAFLDEVVELAKTGDYHPSIFHTVDPPLVLKEKQERLRLFLRGIPLHVVDLEYLVKRATFAPAAKVPTSWKTAKGIEELTHPSNKGEFVLTWLKNQVVINVGYGCKLPDVNDICCAIKVTDTQGKFEWELYK